MEPIFELTTRNDKGSLIIFKGFLCMELKMSSINSHHRESNSYLQVGL